MCCRDGFRKTSNQCYSTTMAVPVALWACYYYCIMFWKMTRKMEWSWLLQHGLLPSYSVNDSTLEEELALPWRKWTEPQLASSEHYFWQTMFFPWIALTLMEDPAGIEVLRHVMFSGNCEDKLVVNCIFWGKPPGQEMKNYSSSFLDVFRVVKTDFKNCWSVFQWKTNLHRKIISRLRLRFQFCGFFPNWCSVLQGI